MTETNPPYRYVDSDDFCLSARLLPDLDAAGVTDTLSITIEGSDEPQSVHVPAADVPAVAAGIVAAAGHLAADQPTDDRALLDAMAAADTDEERTRIAAASLAPLEAVCRASREQQRAADRATLRERLAEAIAARYPDAEPSRIGLVLENPHALADAVLAVLADRADEAQPAESYRPARGDAVEQWLTAQRDEYEVHSSEQWRALDEALDEYRLHADTGTPLGEHACYGPHCDCGEADRG